MTVLPLRRGPHRLDKWPASSRNDSGGMRATTELEWLHTRRGARMRSGADGKGSRKRLWRPFPVYFCSSGQIRSFLFSSLLLSFTSLDIPSFVASVVTVLYDHLLHVMGISSRLLNQWRRRRHANTLSGVCDCLQQDSSWFTRREYYWLCLLLCSRLAFFFPLFIFLATMVHQLGRVSHAQKCTLRAVGPFPCTVHAHSPVAFVSVVITPNYRHIRKHEKVVTIGNSSDFYLHRYERKDRHIVTPYRETRERTKPGWAAQLCAVIQCKIQPCKGLWTRHARAHALARAHTGARNTRPVEIHVLIRRRCVWNTRQSWSCATGSWKIKWYSRKRNQEKHDPSTVQKKRPQT